MKFQQPSENPRTPVDRFFAATSTGLNQWWRWVVSLILIIVFWLGSAQVLSAPLVAVCLLAEELNAPWLVYSAGILVSSPPLATHFMVLNLSFLVGLIGIWTAVRRIHRTSR